MQIPTKDPRGSVTSQGWKLDEICQAGLTGDQDITFVNFCD